MATTLDRVASSLQRSQEASAKEIKDQTTLQKQMVDSLSHVYDEMKSLNEFFKKSAEEQRKAREDEKAAREEAKRESKTSSSVSTSPIVKPTQNKDTSKSSFLSDILSGVGGMGAGVMKGVIGIATMGAAVTAFFGGLLIGEKALDGLVKVIGEENVNFSSIKKIATAFGDTVSSLDENALKATGGLIAAAAAISYVSKSPLKTAITISSMGLAMTAFFGGFVLGESALKEFGNVDPAAFDLSSTKKVITAFGDVASSLSDKTILAVGTVLGGTMALGAFAKNPLKIAGTVAVMGAAISAFFFGFAAGEFALNKFDANSLDFSAMKKVIGAFGDIVDTSSITSLATVGALITIGAGLGVFASPAAIGKSVLGVAAIGAAIGAFFVGFGLGEFGLDWLGTTDFASIKKALASFNDVIGTTDKDKIAILGGLITIGAGFGVITSPATVGKAVLGVAAVGAAIGTFIMGFGLVDGGLSWLNTDFNAIKTGMAAFNDIVSVTSLQTLGVLTGLMAIGTGLGNFASLSVIGKGLVGIAAVSAAIGTFMIGFGLTDKGLDWLKTDFSSIKKGMQSFTEISEMFTGKALAGLTGIIAAGTAIGLTGPTGISAMLLGVGALSAALVAFMAGFAGADAAIAAVNKFLGGTGGKSMKDLLTNSAAGIAEFGKIDGANLLSVSAGIAALSGSLVLFFGAQGLGAVKDTIGKVWNYFFPSDENNEGMISRLVKELKPINDIDTAKLSTFNQFIDSLARLSYLKFDDTADGYSKLMRTISTTPIPDTLKSDIVPQVQGVVDMSVMARARMMDRMAIEKEASSAVSAPIVVAPQTTNNYGGGSSSSSTGNIATPTSPGRSGYEDTMNYNLF